MRGIDKALAACRPARGASSRSRPGEVHALIGQNGAGKSTLIKVLTGYYRRDGGEIMFEGGPVDFALAARCASGGISTIYQEINLVPFRSVTENICLGREKRRFGLLDWHAMHAEADALLARLLASKSTCAGRSMTSTPPCSRWSRSPALSAFEARLVIMDEPTSSLDEREVEVLFDVIRQLKADGVSVIFVSHKLDELYAVCDRVTIMRDGRTVARSPHGRGHQARAGRRHARARHRPGRAEPADRASAVRRIAPAPAARGASIWRPGAGCATSASLCARARSSGSPACSAPDAPRAPACLRRGPRATAATIARRRPADPPRAAGRGDRGGPRLLHRGPQARGHRPGHVGAREPRRWRCCRGWPAPGVVDEARSARSSTGFIKRLGIKCAGARAADPRALGRQPAEGAAGPLAVHEPAAAHPRRADARHRRRRQGRDPAPRSASSPTQGLGVLMISSELEEVVEARDRVFVLRDGRTVAELPRRRASARSRSWPPWRMARTRDGAERGR